MRGFPALSLVVCFLFFPSCGDDGKKAPKTSETNSSMSEQPEASMKKPPTNEPVAAPVPKTEAPVPADATAGSAKMSPEDKKAMAIANGAKIFVKAKCAMCHKAPDAPSPGLGPVLQKLSAKLSDEDLTIWIRDPKKKKPETTMTPFKGSDEELADMIAYLKSL